MRLSLHWRNNLHQNAEEHTQDPSAEKPEKTASEGESSKKMTYARLRDEEQRVAGGGRWSVDSSRRYCAHTREEIPRGTPFWTVLAPADPENAPESAGPLTAFFSRQDYCEEAMAELDPSLFFARWKTVVPTADGPAKRVVNIASLLATFLELVASEQTPSESGKVEESSTELSGDDGGAASEETEEVSAEELPLPPLGLEVVAGTDRTRLAYLLALFLIRKRSLVWEDHAGEALLVREKNSEEIYQIPVPDLDRETLETAVGEIEALFS